MDSRPTLIGIHGCHGPSRLVKCWTKLIEWTYCQHLEKGSFEWN